MFYQPAVHSSVNPFTANQEYVGIGLTYPLAPELCDGSSELFTKNGGRTTAKGLEIPFRSLLALAY